MVEQDEHPPERPRTDRVVFGATAAALVGFLGWGIGSPSTLGGAAEAALNWSVDDIGWVFVLAATGFVIFVLWVALSRSGSIPLGRDDERPEFHTLSWITMMFSAGMGVGLMFFGMAEPLSHFVQPPPGTAAPGSDAAVEVALATSLFHWTLHPWAIYAVVGLTIGYGSFRRGRAQLISSAFVPLLGDRAARGAVGKLIDVLALFATLFGSAASLGIGALQIRSGMQAAGWLGEVGYTALVLIVVALVVCFVASAISGINRGIQWLSNINMALAAVLAVFVFVVGPTVLVLNLLPAAIGSYLGDFTDMASRSGWSGAEAVDEWLADWTIFYWAWWISWAPFVGTFLARISRGRTIRQFVIGAMFVPSGVSLAWFVTLGGTAIGLQRSGVDVAAAGAEDAQTFAVIDALPLSGISTVLVIVLVAIFCITGASSSVVMGKFSQRGSLHPRTWVIVFWGVATGATAATMLVSGGEQGLEGIQNLTFLASVPFTVVMVLMCASLSRDLRADPLRAPGAAQPGGGNVGPPIATRRERDSGAEPGERDG